MPRPVTHAVMQTGCVLLHNTHHEEGELISPLRRGHHQQGFQVKSLTDFPPPPYVTC